MAENEKLRLIVVKFKNYTNFSRRLFQAPCLSNINVGDIVFCKQFEQDKEPEQAEVVAIKDINLEIYKEEFEFVVSAANAELPLPKIIAKYVPIKYK